MVGNGPLDSQAVPNHLAGQGFLLLRVRTKLEEIIDIAGTGFVMGVFYAIMAVGLSLIELKRYDGAFQTLTELHNTGRYAAVSNALGLGLTLDQAWSFGVGVIALAAGVVAGPATRSREAQVFT